MVAFDSADGRTHQLFPTDGDDCWMAGSEGGDDIGQREDRVFRRGGGGLVQSDRLLEIFGNELTHVPTSHGFLCCQRGDASEMASTGALLGGRVASGARPQRNRGSGALGPTPSARGPPRCSVRRDGGARVWSDLSRIQRWVLTSG